MSPPFSDPPKTVALVAPDNAGLDALGPTGEMLDAFGIGWETALFLPCGSLPRLAGGGRWIVAASEDAALPAALAAGTGRPVIRVPVPGAGRDGLALVVDGSGNLPAGPGPGETFATVAIGAAGAKNAALLVVAALALTDEGLRGKWDDFRARQTEAVLAAPPLEG